jgi:predicted RNA-binding Zn ribbon-like protein
MVVVATASPQIPAEARLILDFVNTYDVEDDTDKLASPAELRAWLDERELFPAGSGEPSAEDLELATGTRELLRAVLIANNGGELEAQALAQLNEAAAGSPLVLRFSGDGTPALEPECDGTRAALARILAGIPKLMADGRWRRVKACPADHCEWAFYDHSKNRSRTWCSMNVCGNRSKARAYRERRR